MNCHKCGKGLNEIGGFLQRVNEKGVPGIWECRPACGVEMSADDSLLCALEPTSAECRVDAALNPRGEVMPIQANNPTLDDVMDWYSMEREESVNLADWQRRYPQYASDLAEFEEFLRKSETTDPVPLSGLHIPDNGLADRVSSLEEALRDCWNQFAIERPDGTKWHGGLSTLEEVERVLALNPRGEGEG